MSSSYCCKNVSRSCEVVAQSLFHCHSSSTALQMKKVVECLFCLSLHFLPSISFTFFNEDAHQHHHRHHFCISLAANWRAAWQRLFVATASVTFRDVLWVWANVKMITATRNFVWFSFIADRKLPQVQWMKWTRARLTSSVVQPFNRANQHKKRYQDTLHFTRWSLLM